MQKYFFGLLVCTFVLVVSGCTHTPSLEQQSIDASQSNQGLNQDAVENVETDYSQTPPPSFATIEDASVLVGAWSVIEGGDYQEIDVLADGTFSTFLYEKPFESGTWKLASEGLILDFDNLSDKTYAYVDAEEGLIILESKDYTDRQVWEPIN